MNDDSHSSLHCCLQLFCVVMELVDAVGVDCVHVISIQTKLRTLNALRLATVKKDSFPVWIQLMVSTYLLYRYTGILNDCSRSRREN
jgi:hypothetical protein